MAMAIPEEKQIAFIKKLIEDTEAGAVQWRRRRLGDGSFHEFLLPDVFYGCFKNSEFAFEVSLADIQNHINCAMVYDGVTKTLNGGSAEFQILTKRLFKLVSDQFLCANDFIDAYLSQSGEDSKEGA
jgi:hypothetical protein